MKIGNSLRTVALWTIPAAVGAVAALLLAPQSGRRTRRQVRLLAERCWYSVNGNLEKAEDLLASGSHVAGNTVRSFSRKLKMASKIA